jgi:hypothetical protein
MARERRKPLPPPQKALAGDAVAVLITALLKPTATRLIGTNHRARRKEAPKQKASRASPSCIAKAVRIITRTVPRDPLTANRSGDDPWLKKS